MQRYVNDQLEWLEFDLLSDIPHLKHAVYLRHGGASEGLFASLNASYLVGDRSEHVQKNLECIQNHLKSGVPNWSHIVCGRANHEKSIALVDPSTEEELINYDGLITAHPNVTLMMKHADCQVAIFFDTKNRVIANIHSGWRSSVLNIYRETIETMQAHFGSHPAEILVCISPSLGPDEAEFMHYRSELPEEFWPFQVRPTYFDFWAISEHQLQAAGILPHHIEVARLSTYANPYDFFSYRRHKITGRHATCVTLL
jgi:YfiH family protein